MEEQHTADDQSHYEISLTAGQAFAAFVLLLLSLAASFAFGLMIGKGQADERLVVRKDPSVVAEASLTPKKGEGRIVELGVEDQPAAATDTSVSEPATDTALNTGTSTPVVTEQGAAPADASPAATPAAEQAAATAAAPAAARPAVPQTLQATVYAQLLSTSDQKVAEALAARLIDRGFLTSYVERGTTEKGAVYRVRVRFDSDAAARAAEPKLREFSKDVWITSR